MMRRIPAFALMGLMVPSLVAAQNNIGPRTLLPLHVACAAVQVDAIPATPHRIHGVQHPDSRQTLAPGDVAVIRLGEGQALDVGQTLIAHRADVERNNRRLGDVDRDIRRRGDSLTSYRAVGMVTVTAVDHRFALARVDRVCGELLLGDALHTGTLAELPAVEAAGEPSFDDRARVASGTDRRASFGDGDILAINRGTTHGVVPGQRFAIYREPASRGGYREPLTTRSDELPLVELGEVVVVEVADRAAKAVVVKTTDAILSGDVAVRVTPAQR